MEIVLGCCGLVLAFICIFLGMAEVGLWVACYFECPNGEGRLIEFNYFAAVWTGVLAFTVGFMIVVLFCVKFKSLGTFIVILTFILVPCEIICVCIYGYRAYLTRPMIGEAVTGNVGVDYFSVFLFSAMAVCGVFLFLVTITWNCYYCCIATPVEDFEEEVKEDLEEENERQRDLQATQDSVFVNNPVVDDESRPNQTRPLNFAQQPNQQVSNGRFPQSVQNGYPQAMPRQSGNHRQYGSNLDNRGDNRNSRYPQQQPIRNDYPYPAAFNREPVPEERDRRNRQQSMMPRPQLGPHHQSYMRNDNGRGQVNRGYEPDQFGQPVDRSYNLRSYIYDGMQGDSFEQPIYSPSQPHPQREQTRRLLNHHDANPDASTDYPRSKSRRHVNRPPNYQPPGNGREGGTSTQPRMEDRSYIYRPRPENFRGKPPKPEYMHEQQQQPTAQNSNYLQAPLQNSRNPGQGAERPGGPVDSYF